MSWFARLFRPHVELSPTLAARVQSWRAQAAPSDDQRIESARLVVVDVETSGLDVRRDHLLAIGAVAVNAMALTPGDGYAAILGQRDPAVHETVVLHGIGPQMQAQGVEPEAALMDFLEFAGKDTLIAFHAGFDRAMLDRAMREILGVRLLNRWIDLAWLMPALFPEHEDVRGGLDEWLTKFNLRAKVRHRAAFDAFVTAELLLVALQRARVRRLATLASLREQADAQEKLFLGRGMGSA